MKVVEVLKKHKNLIVEKYAVKKIGVFGSYARNEQTKHSDIDILVEFKNPTFDNFMNLVFYLEDLYEKEIDLITLKSLSPYIAPYVVKEVIWC